MREPKFAIDILWNMFTGKFTLVAQWLANLRLDCPALTLVVSWANSKQIPFIECSTTYLQNTAKLMKVKHEKDWRERQRRGGTWLIILSLSHERSCETFQNIIRRTQLISFIISQTFLSFFDEREKERRLLLLYQLRLFLLNFSY